MRQQTSLHQSLHLDSDKTVQHESDANFLCKTKAVGVHKFLVEPYRCNQLITT